jgi:TIR domain
VNLARGLIFISYRRADTDALAGRLRDRMGRAAPEWEVFVDVDAIPAGADFRQAIDGTLKRASVLVPLIGAQWLGPDRKRLHDPNDMVRYEIKLALGVGMRIVPVLVNDTRMPAAHDLPDDVARITGYNAVELRHSRFDDDFTNLVKVLTGAPPAGETRPARGVAALVRDAVLGALSGVVVSLLLLIVNHELTNTSAADRLGETGAALFIPLCAVLGGLIWHWLASR